MSVAEIVRIATLALETDAEAQDSPEALAELESAVVRLARQMYDANLMSEARRLFERLLERFPECLDGLLYLGELELDEGFLQRALGYLRHADSLQPDDSRVLKQLAATYERLGAYDEADKAWRRGFPQGAVVREFTEAVAGRPRVLALLTPLCGNVRFREFIKPDDFLITHYFTESYFAEAELPECDVIFVGIGDPDLCPRALQKAQHIIARLQKPYVNDPERVLHTGRLEIAERLRPLAGVIVPEIELFSRAQLQQAVSAAGGSSARPYPFLLRLPGYHSGQHFRLLNSEDELAEYLPTIPGDQFLAVSFLDTRAADGSFRKYRVMSIDGELYPLHLAVSHDWKVHYFSSEMGENEAYRAEEERFLEAMPESLGSDATASLQRIFATLDLDYAGIDFTLDAAGNVLVFEANPGMVILAADDEPKWDYRRPAIARALAAARAMTLKKAAKA